MHLIRVNFTMMKQYIFSHLFTVNFISMNYVNVATGKNDTNLENNDNFFDENCLSMFLCI